jgi:hypothetical protein
MAEQVQGVPAGLTAETIQGVPPGLTAESVQTTPQQVQGVPDGLIAEPINAPTAQEVQDNKLKEQGYAVPSEEHGWLRTQS